MRECDRGEWKKFKRYHYLTSDAPHHAKWYGLYDEQDINVGILGVIHYPNPHNKKLKKCSRLVVLPDYQGIGLGKKFLNEVAEIYVDQGFDFAITTSAVNLVCGLCRSDKWILTRQGICGKDTEQKLKMVCRKVKTYTFFYKRE